MEHCVTVCIVPWSFVFSCVTYRHIVPALICSVGTGLNNVPWLFMLDCGTYRQSDLYCSAMGCADGVTHLLICPVGTGFNPRERGLLDKRRTKKSRPEGRQSEAGYCLMPFSALITFRQSRNATATSAVLMSRRDLAMLTTFSLRSFSA